MSAEWVAEHWPLLFVAMCVTFAALLWWKLRNGGRWR